MSHPIVVADIRAMGGSRMLSLMNLSQPYNQSASMLPLSPVNNMPSRHFYSDPRANAMHQMAPSQTSFNTNMHPGSRCSLFTSHHSLVSIWKHCASCQRLSSATDVTYRMQYQWYSFAVLVVNSFKVQTAGMSYVNTWTVFLIVRWIITISSDGKR